MILPTCNTEAMNLHLLEIAATVAPGAHAVLLVDQAGWHLSTGLVVPPNITIMALPPKCPELNPVENVCQFPAAVICIRASSSTSRSKRLIHLSLSWADAVSHDCTAHAQRFLHSLSRISRSLVLHLGVELGSDQDHDDRKPDPDHEADSGT